MLKRLGSFFIEVLEVVVFAVSIFLFVYLLVLQPHKIKGSSMEPNFHNNEYLLTDKLSYRFNEPERGEVIVFKAPPDYEEEFIKRIIGLPGDEVMLKEGQLYVNGELQTEQFLSTSTYTAPGQALPEGVPFTVPADSYFVMGDNREHSFDSRNLGTIPKNKISGKAWFVYWPPTEAGIVKKEDLK